MTSINNYPGVQRNMKEIVAVNSAPYEELFSRSTRHHCPMEVGAYDHSNC